MPADATVFSSVNLLADEALLTGESVPVRKAEWDLQQQKVHPGGDDLRDLNYVKTFLNNDILRENMLRDELNYRLGHFILIERNGISLSWVTHSPFGGQRSGRCHILGNILVLLPCDHVEPGYLKLEFHEHLRKLPQWTKTIYYCFAASLMRIGMFQSLTSEEIKHIASSKICHETVNRAESGTYRLNKYKITVHHNLAVSWQTIGGLNMTISGSCYIDSDIILLGPQKNEAVEGRRKIFFNELKLLPLWNRTAAWGYAESLKICDELTTATDVAQRFKQ